MFVAFCYTFSSRDYSNCLDLSSWQVEVPVVEDRPPFRYKVKNLYGVFDIAEPNHSMSLLGTYFQIILKTPISF